MGSKVNGNPNGTDLTESCWIIDPNGHHFVDMHIAINEIPDQELVVMVRKVGKMDPSSDDLQQLLNKTQADQEVHFD